MNPEIYTERSRGFLQAAQTLAQRSGHQRLAPEHLLKVLLDDREGLAANLLRAAGADPQKALASIEAELAKQPRVEGSGAGQVYLSPELGRVLEQAEKAAQQAGDSFVADSAVRARLAEHADLVDMEGYAIASAAAAMGVPVRLVKHVSDDGDEKAARSWSESVEACAELLGDWLAADQGL